MHISARILRNDASQVDGGAPLSARDVVQRERIARVGQGLMARHGSHSITMPTLAAALGHCVPTIRRHFADVDALLAYLLRQHLQFLAACLGAVPFGPQRAAALRAAYLAATRSVMGGLTEAHLLLVRDRGLLPDDELQPVEDTLQGLGFMLADDLGLQILHLLDSPLFNAGQIECVLQALHAPAGRDAASEPAPKPLVPVHHAGTQTFDDRGLADDAERALVDGLFLDRTHGDAWSVGRRVGADTGTNANAAMDAGLECTDSEIMRASRCAPEPEVALRAAREDGHRARENSARETNAIVTKPVPIRPRLRKPSRPVIPMARRKLPFLQFG